MAKEYIEKVFTKFEDHLNLPNNNRIIFSGKFGIGKSYFLNEFFKDKKYEEEYFPIFLNPVNYSISSNQDIFELIKFDILFQILDKNIIDFENFDFPIGNLVYQYFSNKFLNDFISNVDLLGETIIDGQLPKSYSVLKNLGKLISKVSQVSKRDFENFKKEIEANADLKIIKEFFDKQELRIGSVYENNAITQLIYQLIKSIEAKTKKKTVLVIDDLDRIDPEHIFRILNIFSAHDKENENKFGVEKIVLVCDMKNIASIYHHFYGVDTDFFGYINKFYSLEPFYYSNGLYVKFFNDNFEFSDVDFQLNHYFEFLNFIIRQAIEYNFISARLLFSKDFSSKGIHNIFISNQIEKQAFYNGKLIKHFAIYSYAYSTVMTLSWYFGSKNFFLDFINFIKRDKIVYYEKIFAEMAAMSKLYSSTQNTIYSSNLELSIKTNNLGDFELSDKTQLMDVNLKSFFEKILDVTEKIEVK